MDVLDLADQLVKLTMYPYFEVCHMIICCLSIRADLGQGFMFFSRRHPFACWLSSMLSIFSSTILSNFMLNEPIVGAFSNTQHVILATIVWYGMFYCPLDMSGRFCQFLPIRAIIEAGNELYRCDRVHHGITLTSRIYPTSYFSILIMGVVQGNGSGLIRFMERMFRGANFTPSLNEFMQPSYATKFSLVASIVFIVDRKSDLIWFGQMPHNLVYMCLALFFIYFKLSTLIFGLQDPFVPIENLMGAILFGGIWDAIARVMAKVYSHQETTTLNHHYYRHHSGSTSASSSVVLGQTSSASLVSSTLTASFKAELLRKNGKMCMAVDKRGKINKDTQ